MSFRHIWIRLHPFLLPHFCNKKHWCSPLPTQTSPVVSVCVLLSSCCCFLCFLCTPLQLVRVFLHTLHCFGWQSCKLFAIYMRSKMCSHHAHILYTCIHALYTAQSSFVQILGGGVMPVFSTCPLLQYHWTAVPLTGLQVPERYQHQPLYEAWAQLENQLSNKQQEGGEGEEGQGGRWTADSLRAWVLQARQASATATPVISAESDGVEGWRQETDRVGGREEDGGGGSGQRPSSSSLARPGVSRSVAM